MGIEGRLGGGRYGRSRAGRRRNGIVTGRRQSGWRRRRSGGCGEERQLRFRGGGGLLSCGCVGRLPKRGGATAFAETEDAFVGGAHVGFGAGVVHFFESFAVAADQGEKAQLPFHSADRRKFDFPKIEVGIEKGDAIGVLAVLRADLADDADFGFLVALGPAEDEFLLGRKLVAREEAGAMEAEEDSGSVLGKDFAPKVAPDEEDGDFLRNASAAAHNLWWQAQGQKRGAGGTI